MSANRSFCSIIFLLVKEMSSSKSEDSLAQFLLDYIASWNHHIASRKTFLVTLCNNRAVPDSVFLDKIWHYDPCRYELTNIIRSRELFDKLFAYLNREVATTGITAPRRALLNLIKWPYFDKDCVQRCTFRTVEFWRHYCLYSPTVTEDVIRKYQIPNLGNLCFNNVFLTSCSASFRKELFDRHFTSIMLTVDWRDIFCVNSYLIEHLNNNLCPNSTVRDRLLSIDEVLCSVNWEFLVRYRDFIEWDKFTCIFERPDLTWETYRTSLVFEVKYIAHRLHRFFLQPSTLGQVLEKSKYFGLFLQNSRHVTREVLEELWPFLETYTNYLTILISRPEPVIQHFIEDHHAKVLQLLGADVVAEHIVYSPAWYSRVQTHSNELLCNPTLPPDKWLEVLTMIVPDEDLLKLSTKLSKRLLTLNLPRTRLQKLILNYYHLWDIDFLISQGSVTYTTLRQREKCIAGTARIKSLIFAPGLSHFEREELAERYLNFSASEEDVKNLFLCPYFRVSFLRKFLDEHGHRNLGCICRNTFITQRHLELQGILYDLHYHARNPLVQQVMVILDQELWPFL